jgi:hypothetical protein
MSAADERHHPICHAPRRPGLDRDLAGFSLDRERHEEDELADSCAGRKAMYQLAALTVERRFCLALLFLNR